MRSSYRLLIGIALAIALLVAAPLAFLIIELAGAPVEKTLQALSRPATRTAFTNTIVLVASVTAGAFVLGLAVAFALTRLRLPAPRLWWVLATLPLAVPSYVAGMSWVSATPLRGFAGAWLVLVLSTTPYVTLPAAAALRRADYRLAAVARTLGYSPLRAHLRLTLPQVVPAAAAGALLVALYCLAEYGVVSIMRFNTLTPAIQGAFSGSFNRTLAIALSLVLAAMSLVVIALERLLRRPVSQDKVGTDAPVLALPTWATALVCVGLLGVFALAVGLPIGEILLRLRESIAGHQLELDTLIPAFITTVGLGLAAAVVATILALPISILSARRGSNRAVAAIETATYLGHGLPGIVMGLSMVYLALAFLPFLYQTLGLLVLAYALMFVPKAMGSTRSALAQVPPSLPETARTLGLGPRAAWALVTARLASPGIAAGALIVAVTVMKELPATLMMRPIGVDTLATRLWQLTDIAAYGAAAPYALSLIIAASVPALLLARTPDNPGKQELQ